MGSSPYGTGTNCIRWFFVVCNFIFVALGAIAFAIGVWGIVEGSDYDVITGSDTVSAAAVLLVAGIITFIVAALGIIGACGMWRPLLVIYAIVLVIIFILELIVAILAFVFQGDIRDTIRENMEDAIREYEVGGDSDENDAVEAVQDTFECCGVDNYTDWIRLNLPAVIANRGPPADCSCDIDDDDCESFTSGNLTFNVWDRGCLTRLEDSARAVAIGIGVVGIIFAVIEIGFALIAIGLCCCIYSTHRQSVV